MSNIFDMLDNVREMHKEIYADDKAKRECKSYIAHNIAYFYKELSTLQCVEVIDIYKDCFKDRESNIVDILKSKNIPYVLTYLDSNIEITKKIIEDLARESYDEDELVESLEYIKLLNHKYELDTKMYILKGDILRNLGSINSSIEAYRDAKKLKSLDFTANSRIAITYMSKYKKELSITSVVLISIIVGQYVMFNNGTISTKLYKFSVDINEGNYIMEDENTIVIPLNNTININVDYKKMPFYGNEGEISYKIEDEKIALLNEENKLSAISEGQTYLNVLKDNEVVHTFDIIVAKPKVERIELSLDKDLHEVGDIGHIQTQIIKNYDFEVETNIKYKSTDRRVVVVDNEGTIEVVGAGKASIVVTCGEAQAEEEILISLVVEEINVEDNIELQVGQEHKLEVKVITNADNKHKPRVMFSLDSSDNDVEPVISMDSEGNIKGLREGTQVINVICGRLEKNVVVTVTPKDITTLKVENLTESHEIIDNNLIINLEWDFLDLYSDHKYDIYARFKGEGDFSKIGTASKGYNSYSIEYDLSEYSGNGYVDIYVLGYNDDGESQESKTVSVRFFYKEEIEPSLDEELNW